MSGKIPVGKSMFVWDLERIKRRYGTLTDFVVRMKDGGVTAFLVKLVEGRLLYNEALAPAFMAVCAENGIDVHGWSYNYGETNTWRENNDQADVEAELSARMVVKYGLKSWILNCELEWKGADGAPAPWRDEALELTGWYNHFWSEAGLDVPIGFTSFKFPSAHNLAWEEFLTNVDYFVPQVYWQGVTSVNGPVDQLNRSVREWREKGGDLPFVVAGTIYKESNYPVEGQTWWPSSGQVTMFSQAVKDQGLDGVTYWEGAEHLPVPELWEAVAGFDWPIVDNPEPPFPPEESLLDMIMENSLRLTVIEAGIVDLAKAIIKANVYPIPPLPPVPPTNGNGEPVPPPVEPPPVDNGVETVELRTRKGTARNYLSISTGMNKGGATGIPRMIMEQYPSNITPPDDRLWWRNDKPISVEKGVIKTDGGHLYYKVSFNQTHRIPEYAGIGHWPIENGKPIDLYISNKFIQ